LVYNLVLKLNNVNYYLKLLLLYANRTKYLFHHSFNVPITLFIFFYNLKLLFYDILAWLVAVCFATVL